MRVEAGLLDGLIGGTSITGRLHASAWRDNQLFHPDLPISSWALSWDAGRQVQGQATITIADQWGELAPWTLWDPLAPGGGALILSVTYAGVRVPLGWWRIRKADADERWVWYRQPDGSYRSVPAGGSIRLEADEWTAGPALCRLDAVAPDTTLTCLDEIRRLLHPWLGVIAPPYVWDDEPRVPDTLEYAENRLDAVDALLDVMGARARINGDGTLEVLPIEPGEPVWRIEGGPDGTMVSWSRTLSDDGIVNRVVTRGTGADGRPLIARADLAAGPLAASGPLGVIPVFHDTELTTSGEVHDDADRMLTDVIEQATCDIGVECFTHPGIQIHDRVELAWPSTAGPGRGVEGDVVAMSMGSISGDSAPAATMRLTVRAPTALFTERLR